MMAGCKKIEYEIARDTERHTQWLLNMNNLALLTGKDVKKIKADNPFEFGRDYVKEAKGKYSWEEK